MARSMMLISMLAGLLLSAIPHAQGAPIYFAGNLDVIQNDSENSVYHGVPLGTAFSGSIDDVTFNGSITDGDTSTTFGSLIAAGGLTVTNDAVLEDSEAAFLNSLGLAGFINNGLVDLINIENDTTTANGGRIEIGLSFLFDSNTFANNDSGNYPFPANIPFGSLFFIAEFNSLGDEMYSAVGVLDEISIGNNAAPVPEPSTMLLLSTGLAGLISFGKKRFNKK